MSPASSSRRNASGPYRPTRDPQVLLLVAIVVGVVGLWVLGVMSPATLAGGESGPVFPFSDQSEDGVVRVSANASTIDPGDPVAVTVTVDGRPATDATVAIAGESYETDGDGAVVVRLDDPGSYDVRGTPADGNRTATTTVEVRRFSASLEVAVAASAVTDEAVPVRVTRADGGAVAATVVVAGESYETGGDGVVNVSVATAGEYAVRASKSPTTTHRFEDATATLRVDRRRVQLDVTANESAPRVADRVALSVTRRDTDAPVNATIAFGNRTVSTGDDGVATVSFETAGPATVTARADPTPAVRFRTGDARVDVRRIPVDLAVAVSPDPVAEGERATVVVTRADTGERVPAVVELYGARYATGADGRVSFPFYVPGVVDVRATSPVTPTERFRPANASFVVDGPELALASLDAPSTVRANDTMEVTATFENVGTQPYAGDAVVRVGNRTVRERATVDAGEETTVTWTVVTPETPGNATITVAYEEVSVERRVRVVDDEDGSDETAGANASIEAVDAVEPRSTTRSNWRSRPVTKAESGGVHVRRPES